MTLWIEAITAEFDYRLSDGRVISVKEFYCMRASGHDVQFSLRAKRQLREIERQERRKAMLEAALLKEWEHEQAAKQNILRPEPTQDAINEMARRYRSYGKSPPE